MLLSRRATTVFHAGSQLTRTFYKTKLKENFREHDDTKTSKPKRHSYIDGNLKIYDLVLLKAATLVHLSYIRECYCKLPAFTRF